jgi:hypothetical protein
MTSIIVIPKPTPHLISNGDSNVDEAGIISDGTEYHRYDYDEQALNDVNDDININNYSCGSMDTDDIDFSAPVNNCIDISSSSISRFGKFKDKYIAPASPERASGKWMLINAFCLVWSLSLGVYIMLLYLYYDEFQQEENNDDGSSIIHNPASRESTTDYLVWSLLTSLVWITEVTLRTAFPAVDTIIKVVHKSNNNLEEAIIGQSSARSIITVETIVEHRNKKQITIILLELILAGYFGMQTVLDCCKHWKSHHHQYENDDVNYDLYENYYDYYDNDKDARAGGIVVYSILEQEVDVWVSVFAYAYMTYETYQGYYKTTSNKYNIQRSLTNLTNTNNNLTAMGGDDFDPPHTPHYQQQHNQFLSSSSSLIVHNNNNNSYINNNFDFDDEGLLDNNDDSGEHGATKKNNNNTNKHDRIRSSSSSLSSSLIRINNNNNINNLHNNNHKKKKKKKKKKIVAAAAAALNMNMNIETTPMMPNPISEQHLLDYDNDNNDDDNDDDDDDDTDTDKEHEHQVSTITRITKETITAARIAAINNANNDNDRHDNNDDQQQQQQQPNEGGNDNDADVDAGHDVDEEDKGNDAALVREVNERVAVENFNADDHVDDDNNDNDEDKDENSTPSVHLPTIV